MLNKFFADIPKFSVHFLLSRRVAPLRTDGAQYSVVMVQSARLLQACHPDTRRPSTGWQMCPGLCRMTSGLVTVLHHCLMFRLS